MDIIFGLVAGVILTLLAQLVWRLVNARLMRQGVVDAPNQITTISQVLHLGVQGSPTGLIVVAQSGDVVLSNSSAHSMSLVHDRVLNPDVWKVAQEVFKDGEDRRLDVVIRKRRTGHRVTQVHPSSSNPPL